MADRYLRHIPSGILYIWQAAYAQRTDFEEVEDAPQDEDAPAAPIVIKTKVKTKAKPRAIEPVESDDLEINLNDVALSADASRGLP